MAKTVTYCPCPFCGSATQVVLVMEAPRRKYVTCTKCWCQGPPCAKASEAADAWNNREGR